MGNFWGHYCELGTTSWIFLTKWQQGKQMQWCQIMTHGGYTGFPSRKHRHQSSAQHTWPNCCGKQHWLSDHWFLGEFEFKTLLFEHLKSPFQSSVFHSTRSNIPERNILLQDTILIGKRPPWLTVSPSWPACDSKFWCEKCYGCTLQSYFSEPIVL